jgi:photosystem II stability/assembly factor-like uncharacterized protein
VGGYVSVGPLDDEAVILHTTDGGATWTPQITETAYPLNGIVFVDASNGWAVGGYQDWEYMYGSIVHTTDGGATWMTQIDEGGYGPHFVFCGVAFVDANNGWALHRGGILQTTDGGRTWGADSSIEWWGLNDVCFADANNGWVVGDYGTILHYSGSQWTAPHEGRVRSELALQQNYPNPFNSSTTISWDLPRAGHVALRVFDLLGREVVVLREGVVEAGRHRLTFDGSRLASGIYFARLEAGEFSQTKKVMLMK